MPTFGHGGTVAVRGCRVPRTRDVPRRGSFIAVEASAKPESRRCGEASVNSVAPTTTSSSFAPVRRAKETAVEKAYIALEQNVFVIESRQEQEELTAAPNAVIGTRLEASMGAFKGIRNVARSRRASPSVPISA